MSTGIRRGNFLKKVPPGPFKDSQIMFSLMFGA